MSGPVRPAAPWRSRLSDGLLLVPGIGWLLLFFFVPLVIIFVVSFGTKDGTGHVVFGNLGLQNWPAHWIDPKLRRRGSLVETGPALPDDFLAGHDLVSVFQVGWTVLHDDVSMDVAERLIGVLADLGSDLGLTPSSHYEDIQTELDALRREMTRHWRAGAPWRARDAMDVIAILDMPAWAALLALIDECPVVHAGLAASQVAGTRAVSATAFEFISENSQIASVREFMRSLPEIFRR